MKRIELLKRIKTLVEYNSSNDEPLSYYDEFYSLDSNEKLIDMIQENKIKLLQLLDNTLVNNAISLEAIYCFTDRLNNAVKLPQLKSLAKKIKIKGYSKMNKQELMDAIWEWHFNQKQIINNI